MADTVDILVIGGGVAGLSAAAFAAPHARVAVLEREAHLGVHASGRSATFLHLGIGNDAVRALTMCSRPYLAAPERGIAQPRPALFVATEAMRPALDALESEMRRFGDRIERADMPAMAALVPALRLGPGGLVAGVVDGDGLKLDADRLLQGYAATIRAHGGRVLLDHGVTAIVRAGSGWRVDTARGTFTAAVVVNAAGAWGDECARLGGVAPVGLTPLRRTIIAFDPPAGVDSAGWPFVKTAVDEFYMLPESGRLLASPVDEGPDTAGDAQPEEEDVALAAWRVEQFTTLTVTRIAHRWAGLRTFTADRTPAVGHAADAPGFFHLVGQGGFGLQTSPALGEVAAALILGHAWPAALRAHGVIPATFDPARLGDRAAADAA